MSTYETSRWEKMNGRYALTVPAAGDNTPTVLVVEDEALIRLMMIEELRSQGCAVIEASNAEEALRILRSHGRIDLVLTDMRMPGDDDGARLVRTIRECEEFPCLKVVMVSAEAPDTGVHDLLDGYLSKPFVPSRLTRYLRRLIPVPAADPVADRFLTR